MNRKERRAQAKQGAGPQQLAALLEQASAHLRAGEDRQAERAARELLRQAPDHPFGHAQLAMIAYRAGDPAGAVRHIQRAIALEPGIADFHNVAAVAQEAAGRLEEALPSYRRALELAPDSAGLHSNLGTALMNLKRLDEAEQECRRAVELAPKTAEYHNNLGLVLHEQGKLGAALACFTQAIALNAAYPEAHNNAGNVFRDQGRLQQALAAYEKAVALKPDYAYADSNALLVLAYGAFVPGEELLRRGRAWYERHRPRESPPRRKPERPDPARRLRIGLVSPDLHAHPVAQFLEPLLAAFARPPLESQVEITAYADLHQADAVSAGLEKSVARWHVIAGLADRAVAELVARDRIDILLDLTGHNANNWLRLFATKPAPIQASYLGFPATTGLPTIDYLIADAIAWPEDEPASETVLRLARCHLAYAPPPDAPPVTQPQGPLTFGSFNQLSKLTPETVRLWSAALRALPESRLLLKAAGFADAEEAARVIEIFGAEGIAAERLLLRGRTDSFAAHLASYGEIDIALDPTPYNGTTTTVEALWMGVPVLSLAGATMPARMGASLLTAAGMAQWIAETEAAFVAKAADFGSDRARLATLRATQRGKLAASQLCDTDGLAAALADAFRDMWQSYLAQ